MARQYRRWTAEEEEFLRTNKELGFRRVAEELGRQLKVVQRKARQLALDLRTTRRWSPADLEFLLDNDGLPDRCIADALGTTRISVSQARVRYGLRGKRPGRRAAGKSPWQCPGCKQTFLRTPDETRRRLYCTRDCAIQSRHAKTHLTRACKACGREFEVRLSSLGWRKGTGSYCSRECMAAGRRRSVTKACDACGRPFHVAPCNAARKRFCSPECRFSGSTYRYLLATGYVVIRVRGRDVLEHRHVMAQHIGRPLLRSETVHHLNGDRSDNRLSNLELWSKQHGAGQRVSDKVLAALELIERYSPEELSRLLER